MKKGLLLSIVASTLIMAGGSISPVEPTVDTPEAIASDWTFDGELAAFYKTSNAFGVQELGDEETSAATIGVRLQAENQNIFYGFGAGAELIGLYRDKDFVDGTALDGDGSGENTTAALTQAYISYAINNTAIKAGRQSLPKAFSPFAFTQYTNMFGNTFKAVTVVNTDIQDTTLVGAYVDSANSFADMGKFTKLNEDGIYMITAVNKSLPDTVLKGSYYYVPDFTATGDLNILWGEAEFSKDDVKTSVQGGYIFGDSVEDTETGAFGAKIEWSKDIFTGFGAYSYVNDGTIGIQNFAGSKTPLYTQMIANQGVISSDASTYVIGGAVKAFGAKLAVKYGYTQDNSAAEVDYQEVDVVITKKISKDIDLYAGYAYSDFDTVAETDGNHAVKLVARYNF